MTDTSQTPGPAVGRSRGRLWIAIAALMWSTSGLFVKAPLFAGWPGPVLAFWRVAFASLILLPLVRRPQWTLRLLPMLAVFAAMNWFYLSAMVETEVSNAIWLQYTAPVWVFLASALIFRETIHRLDWMLLVFAILGVAFIVICEFQGESIRGVVFGLLSGLFFGGIAVSLRWLRDLESAWLVATSHLATALVLSPYLAFYPQYWPRGEQWLFLAGLGMFQLGLPYLLFAHGLKTVTSHEASGIALLEPLLVPVWVFIAWRHTDSYTAPRWWTIVGGSLILAGLVLRYAGQWRRVRVERGKGRKVKT
ncbi:MAG: DMT family transporter [Pirellulaceae bacterium]